MRGKQTCGFGVTLTGNEVDLLIEKPRETEIVEIKATRTVMPDLFKGLNYYAALETKVKLTKTLV